MSDAFDLSMPWWHYLLRACVVYFVLLVMIRVSGKRSMGQFTSFDMLLVVLLGNAVQNALLGTDTTVGGGLILAATLIALNWGVGYVSSRSDRAERLFEGVPVVLARDGHVYREVLRRELVSRADFHKAMRENDCAEVDHIGLATLETNGHITILRRGDRV
ncbi:MULTISPECIES: YetF domain-containing protein [unclassified Lysobacter]|uniref:DUF421 domain-containing protein n=1 Tax=unclassified Lysobacter TaxID=2635362 RepID=UPI0006FAC22D|nr:MULTISPECIES: YetF domain-containing protein [unclassified Lysobacter]KQZ56937.1 hypothetical protein ASD53_10625 [Lysobacter sp. Root559]KRC34781.1 hypothetical protein ASE10_08780 [Lysobacter sp. Root76]KRD70470.1 hypothetical protein ASE45_00950 [Lysobacter sp. Root96]